MGVDAKYRWCLSGTPIHNSLDDYGALLQFLRVDQLSEKSQFEYWISSPIKQRNSVGIQRLKDLVRATCLRRTKKSPGISLDLQDLVENIEYVRLHNEDQDLYQFFRKKTAEIAANIRLQKGIKMKDKAAKDENILSLINILRLICNHGKDLLPLKALNAWNQREAASVDWEMMKTSRRACEMCGEELEDGDELPSRSESRLASGYHLTCALCDASVENDTLNIQSVRRAKTKQGLTTVASSRPSAKIQSLISILHRERTTTDGSGAKTIKRRVIRKMPQTHR